MIAGELPGGEGKTLLDVGCGVGRTALAAWEKGYRVLGIDMEQRVIEIAKQQLNEAIKFKVADITKIKFADNKKFDVIVCSEVIEHVTKPQQVLDRAVSLLKEKGIFVMTTPNGMEQWSILDDFGEHNRRFSRGDLEELFGRSGLAIKKIYTVGWPWMRLVVWTYDKMVGMLKISHGTHLKRNLCYRKLYPAIMDKLLKFDNWFNRWQIGTNWVVVGGKQ
ncbi:class I SAM-dependent methyltransferase [Candidatus Amesbacteria bacterium]|nr:class I SAM-dependent methyltransferase [Candidatus Amesbacteria bacterium]